MAHFVDHPDWAEPPPRKKAATKAATPAVQPPIPPNTARAKAAAAAARAPRVAPKLPSAAELEANRRMWRARDLRKAAAATDDRLLAEEYLLQAATLDKAATSPQQRAAHLRDMAAQVDAVTAAGYLKLAEDEEASTRTVTKSVTTADRSKAAHYRDMAAQVAQVDPKTAQGYLKLAEQLEKGGGF